MKILLIEDNRLLSKSIRKGLEIQGISVEIFYDGIQGEQFLWMNHASLDLVILDLMIPGKSGEMICESARKNGIEIPILMLTAKDTLENKLKGFSVGADDYLTKPFEFAELLARVRALLRRPRNVKIEQIKIGDLNIDFGARKILYNTSEIILSPKEWAVFEYLHRHQNQAVSRDSIFENVSDFAKDNWSNTIDVHIKNLRKKLYHLKHEDFIKTIRGVGYRLETSE